MSPDNLLSDFKLYRKYKGGTWYKIVDYTLAGGIEGPYYYWVRDPANFEVIKIEIY